VRTYDGTVYEAERHGVFPESDVALLKIYARGYPYLDVETSAPKLGEEVVVIGYPLGQALGTEPSVTKGIISAVRFSGNAYQLDAAANPGNSGGPVLNKNGDAVGALSFKVRGAEGMAFAVSAELFPLNPSMDGYDPARQSWQTDQTYAMDRRFRREEHIQHNARSLLFRAADSGDVALVKKLLAGGAKVNVRDEDGRTPLVYAAMLRGSAVRDDPGYRSRKLQIAKLLLDNGADVGAANEYGRTALHWAASHFPECVNLLIEHGAKVDAIDKLVGTETPLWCAGTSNSIECAELLLKNGADVNVRGYQGKTILGWLEYMVAHPEGKSDPHYFDSMMSFLRKHGGTE